METLKDLTPESMTEIQNAINSKVQDKVNIHVEKALAEQDELYSKKLSQLLEAIDADHSAKLEKVVEAVDADRAEKLKIVIKKYEKILTEDANNFKSQLVESISDYLDTYLAEAVPADEIKEAVRNKKAITVTSKIHNILINYFFIFHVIFSFQSYFYIPHILQLSTPFVLVPIHQHHLLHIVHNQKLYWV